MEHGTGRNGKMAISESFKDHVNNAEHCGLSKGATEVSLDLLKDDINKMSVDDRKAAFNYMIEQNQKNTSLPQLTIEGDFRTGNFKVQALQYGKETIES